MERRSGSGGILTSIKSHFFCFRASEGSAISRIAIATGAPREATWENTWSIIDTPAPPRTARLRIFTSAKAFAIAATSSWRSKCEGSSAPTWRRPSLSQDFQTPQKPDRRLNNQLRPQQLSRMRQQTYTKTDLRRALCDKKEKNPVSPTLGTENSREKRPHENLPLSSRATPNRNFATPLGER